MTQLYGKMFSRDDQKNVNGEERQTNKEKRVFSWFLGTLLGLGVLVAIVDFSGVADSETVNMKLFRSLVVVWFVVFLNSCGRWTV